jgi:hypothetical protein
MPSDADQSLPPAQRARRYANHLEVAFGVSEVELCFSQAFGADSDTTPGCIIQTTPVHLVSFGDVIARTIATYEDKFGRIPSATPSGVR